MHEYIVSETHDLAMLRISLARADLLAQGLRSQIKELMGVSK